MESAFFRNYLRMFPVNHSGRISAGLVKSGKTFRFLSPVNLNSRNHLPVFLVLMLLLGSFELSAQQNGKFEYERRVNRHEMPVKILEDLADFTEEARRIRYFREFDGTTYTWEVKLIYEGRHFSIEFNQDYSLLDIEYLTHWRLAERAVRQPLVSYFEQNYRRFKIRRLQYTFIPRAGVSQADFLERILDDDLTPPQFYEVEAEVISPSTGEMGFYEFIFDTQFNLVRKVRIIPISDVNLHI